MEDLSVEIQVLHAHFISFSFRCLRDLLVPEDLSQCCHVPRSLVAIVVLSSPVKDTEEVVVCTGNELPVVELKSRTITLNTEQQHFVCSLILYSSYIPFGTCSKEPKHMHTHRGTWHIKF